MKFNSFRKHIRMSQDYLDSRASLGSAFMTCPDAALAGFSAALIAAGCNEGLGICREFEKIVPFYSYDTIEAVLARHSEDPESWLWEQGPAGEYYLRI